jgi:Xaa-Pro aminopeptidase
MTAAEQTLEIPNTFKMPISRMELERRRDAVLGRMAHEDVDFTIVTTPQSVFYLTGINLGGAVYSPEALLLDRDGRHAFVLRQLELGWRDVWGPQTWADQWDVYRDQDDPRQVIVDVARRLHGGPIGRLALETARPTLTYDAVRQIAGGVGANTILPAHEYVEDLRAVKSDSEIALMRIAGTLTRVGTEAAAGSLAAGSSDADAHVAAYAAMAKAGSGALATTPIIGVGTGSTLAHAPWMHVAPKRGDLVTTMVSASVHRYQCPVERTYSMGEPDARATDVLDSAVEATQAVLDQVKPGMTSEEADQIARDVHVANGFGDYFNNRLAYSIGIGFEPVWWENEVMQLRPLDKRVIKQGMAFHLVPGIQVPGLGLAVRSLPVVMTADGFEPLIDLPLRVSAL